MFGTNGLVTNGGWLTRGYTGHEHVPQVDLINMNGRMYDAVLGRMLSPDNYVQDPTNTQSYNRYSYVINNPLKYTDPSGWFLKYIGDGRQVEFPDAPDKSGGGGGGGTRSSNFWGSGWDVTMGFTSMFMQVANTYGTMAAINAYSSGYSAGPGMGFGSAFIGRGFVSSSYFSKSVNNYTSQAGLYGFGGQSVVEGDVTTYQSHEYSYFDRGTLTGNYWTGGSGIDMSTATACNGCGVGLSISAPRAGYNNSGNQAIQKVSTGNGFLGLGIGLAQEFTLAGQGLYVTSKGLTRKINFTNLTRNSRPYAESFTIMRNFGKASLVGGFLLDGVLWYNGNISGKKFGINTGMSAWGVGMSSISGGPVGLGVSAIYFGIDTFYPDGWNGAMNDQGYIIKQTQKIIGIGNMFYK